MSLTPSNLYLSIYYIYLQSRILGAVLVDVF